MLAILSIGVTIFVHSASDLIVKRDKKHAFDLVSFPQVCKKADPPRPLMKKHGHENEFINILIAGFTRGESAATCRVSFHKMGGGG